jgi:hypothetical protein
MSRIRAGCARDICSDDGVAARWIERVLRKSGTPVLPHPFIITRLVEAIDDAPAVNRPRW